MKNNSSAYVGFTCAYTPLPLLDAAGFVPFRILPVTEAPETAGQVLHDNLCPHVKRVLDRGLAGDLPELAGMVMMNSCESMRRLTDGWRVARPLERLVLLDLPTTTNEPATRYFAGELERLVSLLSMWSGRRIRDDAIFAAMTRYLELARGLEALEREAARGDLAGGWAALQEMRNRSVSFPVDKSLDEVRRLAGAKKGAGPERGGREADLPAIGNSVVSIPVGMNGGERTAAGGNGQRSVDGVVPVFVFGNVLAEPEAFRLIEECGARIVADDLCTGSRQMVSLTIDESAPPLPQLARALLHRPLCARTLGGTTGGLATQIITRARESGARGVIAHVMKFCDPYLARLPSIREALREAGLPLLVLEGDCTLRALGQQRTRVEAFVEMLGGAYA